MTRRGAVHGVFSRWVMKSTSYLPGLSSHCPRSHADHRHSVQSRPCTGSWTDERTRRDRGSPAEPGGTWAFWRYAPFLVHLTPTIEVHSPKLTLDGCTGSGSQTQSG